MTVRGDALLDDGVRSDSLDTGLVQAVRRSDGRAILACTVPNAGQDPERNDTRIRAKESGKPMAQTLQKNIRVTPEQWDRIENAAVERDVSANRLVVELAMEALDRRDWAAQRRGDSGREILAVRRPGPRARPDRERTGA